MWRWRPRCSCRRRLGSAGRRRRGDVSLADLEAGLDTALVEAREAIPAASNLDELKQLERRFAGKKASPAAVAKESIKGLDAGDRAAAGKAVGAFTAAVEALVAEREVVLRAEAAAGSADRERLDLTVGGHGRHRGHLHLV